MSAIGLNELFVFGQRVERALVDVVGNLRSTVKIEGDFVACGKQGGAEGGGDHPLITHFGGEQSDVATVVSVESALVDD